MRGPVLALAVSLGLVIPVTAVDAAKKPAAPVITAITRLPGKKKLYNVRVTVELPQKLTGKSTYTEVSLTGGKTCRVSGSASSCTVVGVQRNLYFSVRARSRTSAGFGAWSARVSSTTTVSGWVRTGYDASGKKYPAAVPTSALYWKMLGTTSKWSKFQALRRSNTSSAAFRRRMPRALTTCGTTFPPPVTTTTAPVSAGDPCVAFNLDGVVGLAMATSSSTCGSNVECALAVAKDGTTSSLFATGGDSPGVKDFYSAPNGRTYVVFKTATRLVVGGSMCVFAEVNMETGLPTCVDPEMNSIQTQFGNAYGAFSSSNGNPPVQFDSAGTVYYTGQGSTSSGFFSLTLRASTNGVIRNVVNDNVTITDFIVLTDGTVIMSGRTTSTNQYWLRKVSPGGAITNLSVGSQATFLRQFADGNVYFGFTSSMEGPGKVLRYNVANGAVDDLPWISGSYGYKTVFASQNDISPFCTQSSGATSVPAWCTAGGSSTGVIFNMGSARTVGIFSASGSSGSTLLQYWPTVEPRVSVLTNIYLAYRVNDLLFLAGTNSAKKNVLTAFNTATNQEEIILDGSNETEIYSMAYVPSTKKLMFNGLNFADGKYIVSEIAIP
jgi:hypothetical protein